MKKWIRPVAVSLLLTFGCSALLGCQMPLGVQRQEIQVVSRGGTVQLVDEPQAQVSTRAADFAYVLLGKQVEQQAQQNVLLSPLSAFLALAMTSQGAQEDTKAAFVQCFQGMSQEEQRNFSAWLMHQAVGGTDEKGDTGLVIANSIWCDDEITVAPAFINTVEQYFGADIINEDLQEAEAVAKVNQWVADATADRIPDMLQQLSPEAVMLLVNALTLDAAWEQPFEATRTWPSAFTCADGTVVEVPFLHSGLQQGQFVHAPTGDAVLLPYQDSDLIFVALLPAEQYSCEEAAKYLDATAMHQLLQQLQTRASQPMVLSMPKFEVATETDLKDLLQPMGLGVAFDPDQADFSGLGTASGNIWLSRALQQCVLQVDEGGTKAAAATVIEMNAEGAQEMPAYYQLELNRPFLYFVIDASTEFPVFAGILNQLQPSAETNAAEEADAVSENEG